MISYLFVSVYANAIHMYRILLEAQAEISHTYIAIFEISQSCLKALIRILEFIEL